MFLVILPYITPTLIAALKLAASSALVLVVVAEMFIGTNMGVGKVINDMTYSDQRAAQYAAIVSTGALGYGFNVALERLRQYVLSKGNSMTLLLHQQLSEAADQFSDCLAFQCLDRNHF